MSQKITLNVFSFFLCVLLIGFTMSCAKRGTADFVLTNGKIVTVDKNKPEAQALAARDGIIIDIGTNEEIERHICETTEVNRP